MQEPLSVHEWWRAVERASSGVDPSPDQADAPAWFGALTRAALAQLSLDLGTARSELDATGDELPAPWKRVRTLLYARLDARRSQEEQLVALAQSLQAFAADDACEPETRARALHTVGVLGIRLNRFGDAEDALTSALEAINDDSPSRNWIIDGLGQVYFSQGAWEEARRTFHRVAELKEQASDSLGVAITMGHLAHMEMSLGKPEDAAYRLKTTLESPLGKDLAPLSQLRLRTFLLQARLDLNDEAGIAAEEAAINGLLDRLREVDHYLKGYAALALARASSRTGSVDGTRAWLGIAGERLTLADQATLLRYWEARLVPGVIGGDGWYESMQKLFDEAGVVTEGEILTLLLLARRASDSGETSVMSERLGQAFDRAVQSNNPLWIEIVDHEFGELDPKGLSRRVVERFSGRTAEELEHTTKERVTMIFADLVNFTARSQELSPAEVMATVRSLFELSVPLLDAYRVRPVQYLGDGLLATCQGEGHAERALRFSIELVRKTARVSRVRRALGDKWGLELRAGCASGPVVLGLLGTALKQEYLAIGRTTNLAARLQAKAEPGEVVCCPETAAALVDQSEVAEFPLKGFDGLYEARRFRVAVER